MWLRAAARRPDRLVPELAEILPDLPPPFVGEPDHERLRLCEATASFLGTASGLEPLLLVIDDLHWAAPPTLQLLRQIARLPPPVRLMVLGTFRDTEKQDDPRWNAALSDLWRDADIRPIALTGLDAAGVVELVQASAGEELDDDGRNLALAVRDKTNGNPFFIGQVLRHLSESGVLQRSSDRWVSQRSLDDLGLPSGVREVVGHRLQPAVSPMPIVRSSLAQWWARSSISTWSPACSIQPAPACSSTISTTPSEHASWRKSMLSLAATGSCTPSCATRS